MSIKARFRVKSYEATFKFSVKRDIITSASCEAKDYMLLVAEGVIIICSSSFVQLPNFV
jgi:hypothetical protein